MNFVKSQFHFITSIAVFAVYLFTIAPSVVQIDSGELAAVQATLGIAHPTGYPLFTIIGHIFSLLPLPFTKIFQLNLLAAIYCSAAVGVFTYTIKFSLDNLSLFDSKQTSKVEKSKTKKKKKQKSEKEKPVIEFSETVKIISAVFGGLVLAFSKTFWFQSTSVEVYSLHLLLMTFIIFSLTKAFTSSPENGDTKYWYLFAAVLALGFTNHMTTLLILPGTAYLYFSRLKLNQASLKRMLVMILIFLPVLILVYSYLPIRASQNPVLNWGNPVDFERILRHISGKQYQVWLFSSIEAAKKQLVYFFNSLPGEFLLTLLVSLLGLIFTYIKSRKLFIFLIITFASTVLYSINYDIHDIDSYFLLAFIALSFFAAYGALRILILKDISRFIPVGILGVIIVIQFYFNVNKVNQGDIYTFEDYTKAVLGSVPENSIVFSYQWDYFLSASYYYQFVEDYRPSVIVVDKELLRRSWYFNQLDRTDSTLLSGISNDVKLFIEALKPFERDEQFDANRLEFLYRKIMTDLITTNIDKRDFYVAPELFEQEMQRGEFTLPPGYTLVPDLFFFKVVKGNDYTAASQPDFMIRFPNKRNHYIDMIERFAASMLTRRAMYEIKHGNREKAKIYIQKVVDDLPNYKLPPELRQIIN